MTDDINTPEAGIEPELVTELTLVLQKPITFAKTQYELLELTEPTVGQLINSSKGSNSFEQLALLLHHNAKVPRGVIDQIGQRDFQAAAAFYGNFSQAFPTT